MMVADTTSSSSRLLSASTLESFHSEPTEKDILPEFPCFMTKGGVSLDRPPTIPPANPLPPKFKCEGIEGKGFHKIMIYSRDYLNISSAQRHSCCSITENERMIMIRVALKNVCYYHVTIQELVLSNEFGCLKVMNFESIVILRNQQTVPFSIWVLHIAKVGYYFSPSFPF